MKAVRKRRHRKRDDGDPEVLLSALASVLKIVGTAVVVIYHLLRDH